MIWIKKKRQGCIFYSKIHFEMVENWIRALFETYKYARKFIEKQYEADNHDGKSAPFTIFFSILQQDLLQSEPAILWIDTSQRLQTNNFTDLYQKVRQNDGIALLYFTGNSVYSVTHPKLYKYVPTNITSLMDTGCFQSTMMVTRTKAVYRNVLWWYFMCSLDRKCIAPTNRIVCDVPPQRRKIGDQRRIDQNGLFGGDQIERGYTVQNKNRKSGFFSVRENNYGDVYLNCHRFDMSVINLILANFYQFQTERYSIDGPEITRNFKTQRNNVTLVTKHLCVKKGLRMEQHLWNWLFWSKWAAPAKTPC